MTGANVNRANVNTGNINTGDVNVNVDNNYGCCGGYGYGGWGAAAATSAVVATTAAVTTAAVMGAYYPALPTGCVAVKRGAVTYYQCGPTWYQPVYSGMSVQYMVVPVP